MARRALDLKQSRRQRWTGRLASLHLCGHPLGTRAALPTHSDGAKPAANSNHSKVMSSPGRRLAFFLLTAFIAGVGSPAFAQSTGDAKAKDQPKANVNKTEAAHLAEVARQVQGSAGYPECAHLGENAISLMMRNDLDTALRHIDLYDRFGCPGARIQTSFRCALRIGTPVAKDGPSLEDIVRACWIDPATTSLVPAAAAPAATPPPATPGTGAH